MPEFDLILLGVAAILFVVALIALLVWTFKTFFGRQTAPGFMRTRDKRLGVVETANVDGRRKLVLVRRDHMEHLIITGGPVDLVLETGIRGRPQLDPPLEDVIIAKSETRPGPEFGKT